MSYQEAKEKYAALGVYTDAAIQRLRTVPVSLHCWQGDDVQKALLFALLQPNEALTKLQNHGMFTELMVCREQLKTMPFGEAWDEYCRVCGKPVDGEWYPQIMKYEKDVLEARE